MTFAGSDKGQSVTTIFYLLIFAKYYFNCLRGWMKQTEDSKKKTTISIQMTHTFLLSNAYLTSVKTDWKIVSQGVSVISWPCFPALLSGGLHSITNKQFFNQK